MIAVNLDRVRVTYVSEPVFADLSWEIHDDRCVGLIGPNGCGKSTLLRLIAGELTTDTGFAVRRKGLTIGYLPQEPRLAAGRTVWQEALAASSELARVEAELARLEGRLGDPAVYGDGRALARAHSRPRRASSTSSSSSAAPATKAASARRCVPWALPRPTWRCRWRRSAYAGGYSDYQAAKAVARSDGFSRSAATMR